MLNDEFGVLCIGPLFFFHSHALITGISYLSPHLFMRDATFMFHKHLAADAG
jgi:hypothetical protein